MFKFFMNWGQGVVFKDDIASTGLAADQMSRHPVQYGENRGIISGGRIQKAGSFGEAED